MMLVRPSCIRVTRRAATPMSLAPGASTWWRWTNHGAVHLDFRPMDVVRWATFSLDIGPLEAEQGLLDAVNDLAEEALFDAQGRSVVARLDLTGRGQLNGWLRTGDTVGDIREQLNDRYASRSAWLWCEGTRVDTASPLDRALVARREDFVGDLARLGEEIGGSDAGLASLRRFLEPLYSRSEVRGSLRVSFRRTTS